MIRRYQDFEISIFEENGEIFLDVNGRPFAINLPQPIRIPRRLLAYKPLPQADEPVQIAAWGEGLYRSIFLPAVESCFQAYLNRRGPEEGVRICFDSRSSTWSAAAWELLCNRLQPAANFLALDPRTPVIRIPRIGQEVYLRELRPPLRILVILASPKRLEKIDALKEKKAIQDAISITLSLPVQIEYFGFDDPSQSSFDAVQTHLASQRTPYDIVHIIGHGLQDEGLEGALAFVNPADGTPQIIPASSLANLLRSQRVMLVILQACQSGKVDTKAINYSSLALQLVAAGVPAVLAMQEDIDQDLATRFFERMYDLWINQGCLFDEAVTQARGSIYQLSGHISSSTIRPRAWATPVLYICPGLQLRLERDMDFLTKAQTVWTNDRLLDAALPSKCQLGKETELFVMIRPVDKPGLFDMIASRPADFEASPGDVRSSQNFFIDFPFDQQTGEVLPVDLRVIVESGSFSFVRNQQNIRLHHQGEQILCVFLLTPLQLGRARVTVRLYDWENDRDISNLLVKTIVDRSVPDSLYTVVSAEESITSWPKQALSESASSVGQTGSVSARPSSSTTDDGEDDWEEGEGEDDSALPSPGGQPWLEPASPTPPRPDESVLPAPGWHPYVEPASPRQYPSTYDESSWEAVEGLPGQKSAPKSARFWNCLALAIVIFIVFSICGYLIALYIYSQ